VALVIVLRKIISLIRPIVVFVVFFPVPVIFLLVVFVVSFVVLFGLLRSPARRNFRGI
jgi:hypothetical protein